MARKAKFPVYGKLDSAGPAQPTNRIVFSDSMKLAGRVLVELRKTPIKGAFSMLQIEAFANMREQGYCLHAYPKASIDAASPLFSFKASFARERGSDSVIIYFGPGLAFDGDNVPNVDHRHGKLLRSHFITGDDAPERAAAIIASAFETFAREAAEFAAAEKKES